ncbi:MAG: phage portal protein [Candidatus Aminicenantes bacterium]|nr:phage portal protein [Candidatus Aminicenantes bacterium]
MSAEKNTKKSFAEILGSGIDRAIGIFSPQAESKRRYFRHISKSMFGSYRGAKSDRFRSSWGPGGGSADQDLLTDLPKLRERSRDLIRNDAIASGGVETIITNIIGSGIKPQSRVDKEVLKINEDFASQLQKQLEKIWTAWVPYADAGNRLDFYEIEELEERSRFANGESIILPLRIKDRNRPYSLVLQSIESDRLSTPGGLYGSKDIRSGVKIGKYGEPVEYWIKKTHPGDWIFGRGSGNDVDSYIRYPARDKFGVKKIFHLYHVLRSGQTRGEPFFAPVINLFKDRYEYMEAELVAARLAACIGLIVKKDNALGAAIARKSSTDSDNKRIEEITPAMVEYLEPGESIEQFAPNRPGGTFGTFMERVLRDISSGLNIPYEILSKDFSKSNYSNTRAALIEARRFFQKQQRFVANKLGQPVFEMLIEEAYLKGELPILDFYQNRSAYVRTKWISPGWSWIDPQKEVKAAVMSVDNNHSTLADEASAHGGDWEEIQEQRARELKKQKDLELEHGIKFNQKQRDESTSDQVVEEINAGKDENDK